MARIYIALLILLFSSKGISSSCCGQSPASFTILSSDQKLNISTTYSTLSSKSRALNNQVYHFKDQKREIQSLQLNLATAPFNRNQFFFNTALLKAHYKDSFQNDNSYNLSDTLVGYSYEVLPEYSFSLWKPIIHLTALLSVPTGNSIYDEIKLSEGADVTGHNQWGLGFGASLKKVYFPLTLTLQVKSIKLFSNEFNQGLTVSGFYDSSASLLMNYNTGFSNLSLNTGTTFSHLSRRKLSSSDSSSDISYNTSFLIGVQRTFGERASVSLSYLDQTLIKKYRNTVLNKSLNLNFNYMFF